MTAAATSIARARICETGRAFDRAKAWLSAHFPSISTRRPPARSTRSHSATPRSGSGRFQMTCRATTRSKVSSAQSRAAASPTRKLICWAVCSAFLRARSIICGDRSIPVTAWPSSANLSARKPVPHPTSSTHRGSRPARRESRSISSSNLLALRSQWCRITSLIPT